MSVKVSGISACLAFICSWLMCNEAHAGPPFRTDDPEPVAYGHFEFYAFSEGTRAKDAASGALPGPNLTTVSFPTVS